MGQLDETALNELVGRVLGGSDAVLDADQRIDPGFLAEAETRFSFFFPHPVKRMAIAVGEFERQRYLRRQGMEQAHADPGFGNVAHNAQELAVRAGQLGRADQ
mgnify:CR=1 FL=1